MTLLFMLKIDPSKSLEEAWSLLESEGITVLYGSEDSETVEVVIEMKEKEFPIKKKWILSATSWTLPSIDWESQWAAHGNDYREGYVHIDLSIYREGAPTIRLQPGPGFGDFSHPTTRLALHLLSNQLENQTVIDIGSGSGVLSIAAATLGAQTVYGIEIDPEAIFHSEANSNLNKMDHQIHFTLPEKFNWEIENRPVIIIMNMISAEQSIAWESLPSLHSQKGIFLTTGIHVEGREEYLLKTKKWGWNLLNETQEKEWLGFCFSS